MVDPDADRIAGYREACQRVRVLLDEYFDTIYNHRAPFSLQREGVLAHLQQHMPHVCTGCFVSASGRDGERLVADARAALERFDRVIDRAREREYTDTGDLTEAGTEMADVISQLLPVVEALDLTDLPQAHQVLLAEVHNEERFNRERRE